MTEASARYVSQSYDAIAGWAEDDHRAAFASFLASSRRLVSAAKAKLTGSAQPVSIVSTPDALLRICEIALAMPGGMTKAAARAFFETHFIPHRVVHAAGEGLVTGYYEPVLKGSRTRDGRFTTPIYRRPGDLVNIVDETQRGAKAHALTHLRETADGKRTPYPTRQEIDEGALAGKGFELLYLEDPVDVFFMQIQGSGRIALPDGAMVRVSYDGKNGHPYTSVGRYLIDSGKFVAEQVSLQSLETWLKADPARGRAAMWQNKSYVFFRELVGEQASGPLGAMSIPLTEGRSLAVDTGFHALGLPVWVSAPTLRHATRRGGFHRLMISQDVGSAIRGPERGDIYFGSGDAAGRLAGVTKHPANFIVLLPKPRPVLTPDEELAAGRAPNAPRSARQ